MKTYFALLRRFAVRRVSDRSLAIVFLLACLLACRGWDALAQANLGQVNVGASASNSVPVTVTTAGVLGSISVRMMGAEGLDFTNAGGGSCATGTAYAVNTTCTVNVGFAPRLAGQRRGAVVLLDASGNLLGAEYVQGTGEGPQATILTGAGVATGIPAPIYPAPLGLAVNGADTVWESSYYASSLNRWTLSGGGYIRQGVGSGAGSIAADGAGIVYVMQDGEPPEPVGDFPPANCGTALDPFYENIATDGAGNEYIVDDIGQASGVTFSSGTCSYFSVPYFGQGAQYICCLNWSQMTIDPDGNFIFGNLKESYQQGTVVTEQLFQELTDPLYPVSDGTGNLFVSDGSPNSSSGTQSTYLSLLQSDGTFKTTAVADNHVGPLAIDWNGNLFTDGGAYKFNLLNPSPVSFPSAGAGQSSANLVITVANTGNAPLTIGSVTYPADFPEAKGIPGDCTAGQTVAVGGSCTITAVFSPSAALNGATSQTLSETVKLISNSLNGAATEQDIPVTGTETLPVPAIALSSSANPVASGGSVTLTAKMTSATGVAVPTGTVTFLDGTTTLGTGSLSGGSASYTVTGFSDGSHSITAQYGGDSANGPAVSTALVQVVGISTPVITWATPAAITAGTPLSATQLDATASVAGSFVYSPTAGTVLSAGQQMLMTTFTPTDTTLYRSATASVTLTVNPPALPTPTITVTSSKNPCLSTDTITLTVAVASTSGTPTGTVTTTNSATGQTLTGTLVSGSQIVVITSLMPGVNPFTVVYSGDANFAPATSATFIQLAESFSIVASGSSSATVSPGGTAAYALTATVPTVGTTLSFSVTGLPTGATATFSPATIPLTGTAATTPVTLSVTVPALKASDFQRGPLGRTLLPVALGVLVLPFAMRRRFGLRSRVWSLLFCLATGIAALGLGGCGAGGGGHGGTTPASASYALTVTATSGLLTQSSQLTLIVD